MSAETHAASSAAPSPRTPSQTQDPDIWEEAQRENFQQWMSFFRSKEGLTFRNPDGKILCVPVSSGTPALIDGKPVDFFALYAHVFQRGGYHEVCKRSRWGEICQLLVGTAAADQLRNIYEVYVYVFELLHKQSSLFSVAAQLVKESQMQMSQQAAAMRAKRPPAAGGAPQQGPSGYSGASSSSGGAATTSTASTPTPPSSGTTQQQSQTSPSQPVGGSAGVGPATAQPTGPQGLSATESLPGAGSKRSFGESSMEEESSMGVPPKRSAPEESTTTTTSPP